MIKHGNLFNVSEGSNNNQYRITGIFILNKQRTVKRRPREWVQCIPTLRKGGLQVCHFHRYNFPRARIYAHLKKWGGR